MWKITTKVDICVRYLPRPFGKPVLKREYMSIGFSKGRGRYRDCGGFQPRLHKIRRTKKPRPEKPGDKTWHMMCYPTTKLG